MEGKHILNATLDNEVHGLISFTKAYTIYFSIDIQIRSCSCVPTSLGDECSTV